MLNKIILGLFVVVGSVVTEEAIFLELTDEEYHQLPELFSLENYERCLSQRGNAYCAGTFELSGSTPLYDVMKKFSENIQENFNHTRIHRAVCLGPNTNCAINGSLEDSFEDCINKRMMKEYEMNAKIIKLLHCKTSGQKRSLDGVDIAFFIYLSLVVLMNLIGTAYHWLVKEENAEGNQWLMSFSLIENWKRLTEPSKSDQRLQNFTSLNGMKAMSMMLVFLAHTTLIIIIAFVANPRLTEMLARRPDMMIFANGTVIVQTFILITNFLIAYRLLIISETNKLSLSTLPMIIIYRLVRIYPIQLTSIVATIAAHVSDGPLWNKYAFEEALLCRTYWWQHVLFINNLFEPRCVPQTWYIATDVQLYIISSALMLWIISRGLDAEFILKWLIAVSLAFVFSVAYIMNLKPALKIQNPETLLSGYANEKSFKLLYTSSWGNFPSALIGLLTACIYYRLEKEKVDLRNNKIFVAVYRMTLPMGLVWILMAYFFILTMNSRFTTSLYATIDKPVFALIMALLMLGCFSKTDGLIRNLLSWSGWLALSRMSMGALFMHVVINKTLVLTRINPSTLYFTTMVGDWFAVIVMTYIIVTPFTLFVEYPAVQLFKTFYNGKTATKLKSKYAVNENNNVIENTISTGKHKEL